MSYIQLIFAFIIVLVLSACNLTPQKHGGNIPDRVNISDININIVDYMPSDLSLRIGDRSIKNSSFVISNFSNVPDFELGMVGALGVLALDSNYEVRLPIKLEERLAKKFNLSKILFSEFKSFKSPSEYSSIKFNESKSQVNELILESYALIKITENGVVFNSQIIASLYDNRGVFIWQNHYGYHSKVQAWGEWTDRALNDFFISAYKQLTIEVITNLNGEHYHHKIIPDPVIGLNLPDVL
jgi:hypothetical protein